MRAAVVGAVTGVGARAGGRLHEEGADPAVPEQVDRRSEDRAHHLVGREGSSTVDVADAGNARRAASDEVDRASPRVGAHAAAQREHRGIVVGPRGGRLLEQAPAVQRTTSTDRDRGRRTRDGGRTATSCTWGDRSRPLPNTSPDMSPMPTTPGIRRPASTSTARKCAFTDSHAPRRRSAQLSPVVETRRNRPRRTRRRANSRTRQPRRWRRRRTHPSPCRRRPRGTRSSPSAPHHVGRRHRTALARPRR